MLLGIDPLSPERTSRICVPHGPVMVTRAPMASRLLTVPCRRTRKKWLPLGVFIHSTSGLPLLGST